MKFKEYRLDDGQLYSVFLYGSAVLRTDLFAVGVRGKQEIDEGYLAAGTKVYPSRKPSEPEDSDGSVTDAWVYVVPADGGLVQRVLYSSLKAAV